MRPLSQTCAGLVLASCALSAGDLYGQQSSITVESSPYTPSHQEALTYIPGRLTATIKNRFPEQLEIRSLIFKLSAFKVNVAPRVVFELTPICDLLAVRAVNVGWGTYGGAAFSIFDEKARTNDGRANLKTLFGITETTQPLTQIDDVSLLLFRTTPTAALRGWAALTPIDLSLARPPEPLELYGAHTQHSRSSSDLKYEMRATDPEPAYSGATDFNGRLWKTPTTSQLVTYNFRELARPSLRDTNDVLRRRFGSSASGGLFNKWRATFGNIVAVPVLTESEAMQYGVTVDIEDGKKRSIIVPLALRVRPATAVQFDIEFLSHKSADFSVAIDVAYRFGSGPWTSRTLPTRWNVNTVVPKLTGIDGVPNRADFLSTIIKVDPDLVARSKKMVEGYSWVTEASQSTDLHKLSKASLLADACEVCVLSDDQDAGQAATRLLEALTLAVCSMDDDALADEIGRGIFTILCEHLPNTAVKMAASRFRKGSKFYALDCCSSDMLRQSLAVELASELKQYLGDGNDESNDELFAILGSSLNLPDCAEKIASLYERDRIGSDVAVWCTSQLRDRRLIRMVGKRIADSSNEAIERAVAIQALVDCRLDSARSDVIECAGSIQLLPQANDNVFGRTELVAACVKYFETLPGRDSLAVLQRFKDYAESASIRKRVNNILNEAPTSPQ
jgi:hypothetical protein